ncbi:MAG: SRPBCC family protein [Candidatus Cyclobacteriaceae bacterium M2_1C_046]
MKIYRLETEQVLPLSLEEAWDFFSSPKNLARITPPHMGFKIEYTSGINDKMYPGQIIQYKVQVVPGIPVQWVTEITHVDAPNYFVDEQRYGPYAMWHHQHHFEKVKGGIKMTDIVNYALPLSALGRLANGIFVERQVKSIFDYRSKTLENMFNK